MTQNRTYRNTGRSSSENRRRRTNSSSRYKTAGQRYSAGSSQRSASSRRTSSKRSRSYKNKNRKRKRSSHYFLPIIILLLIIICLGGTLFLYHNGKNSIPDITVDLEQLDSPYAVLMDRETGTVLSSKRSTERMYPASLTKMMTVLTALDECPDLDQQVTLSYDYFQELYDQDASRAGFEAGETARIIDLMYGAILPSGAECCKELAVQSAGSEADFVVLMNQKAEKLGLSGTHFANSTGLHDEEQYSTAEDLARLLRAALKNDTFYEIITSRSYYVPPSDVHPDGFVFYGTMFKNMEDASVAGGEILGGKTGFTNAAGHCLASFARVDDRDYILVTGGIPEAPRTEQYHISDAFRAYGQISQDQE